MIALLWIALLLALLLFMTVLMLVGLVFLATISAVGLLLYAIALPVQALFTPGAQRKQIG